MIVTLDGQRVDQEFSAEIPLCDVLEHVRSRHLDGRLIVAVARNGETLTDHDLQTALPHPVAGDAQIDLESGEARALVRDALAGLALEFADATMRFTTLPDRLHGTESGAAIREIGEFIALWQTLYRGLTQCSALLGVDLAARIVNGEAVKSHLTTAVGKLNELRNALESRDIVLVADLLRYELLPLCDTWPRVLTTLAEDIADPG